MTDTRTPLVDMKNISISFGGIHAVDNASVDLYPGEVVALLGHNGAGKSTLIKILSGVHEPDSGSIRIEGRECDLTSYQFDILHVMAQSPGRVLSRDQIMDAYAAAIEERYRFFSFGDAMLIL